MKIERDYGNLPRDLGVHYMHLPEHMSYLYLPVRIPRVKWELILPANLEVLRSLVEGISALYAEEDDYVYVSAKRGHGVLSRPGWHSDGFRTMDQNFLWSKGLTGTVFATGDFGDVPTGHKDAMEHFTDEAEGTNGLSPLQHVRYEDQTLLMLDQSVIHRPPAVHQGERQFVKVTLSKKPFNLEGNSHNPGLKHDWKMYDRKMARNMEHVEERDFVDPRM
jgi:hypothetical protein